MALYPTPHTPEWFDALRKLDPRKAAMTKQIIELAGRDDVCSVCGDDPAQDYKLVDPAIPQNAVATLRLCEDCHEIRSGAGERFDRL